MLATKTAHAIDRQWSSRWP